MHISVLSSPLLRLFSLAAFFTFTIVFPVAAQEDTYYVIHIKGKVTNTTSRKALKVGDAVKASEQISFNPETSGAILMSSIKGRFSLGKPAKAAASSTGEFITFVKNTLIPVTSVGNLSTRGNTIPCTDNLKKTLGSDAFIFPDDLAVICMDRTTYPMTQNTFFVYRTHNGDKEANYMIPFSGDSLLFQKEKFHTSETGHEKKADIYYYDKKGNSSVKITTITPVYVSAATLKEELAFLIRLYKKQKLTDAIILTHLAEHVQDVYHGRTDEYMLERWLKTNGLLVP